MALYPLPTSQAPQTAQDAQVPQTSQTVQATQVSQDAQPAPAQTEFDAYNAFVQTPPEPAALPPALDLLAVANDPASLAKVASQFDPLTTLTPEVRQALPETVQQALLAVSQAAYRQALTDATRLAGHAVATQAPHLQQQMAQVSQETAFNNALQAALPANAPPATQLVLQSLSSTLRGLFPTEPPAAIAQRAQNVLRDMATSIAPAPPVTPATVAQQVDFREWLLGPQAKSQ